MRLRTDLRHHFPRDCTWDSEHNSAICPACTHPPPPHLHLLDARTARARHTWPRHAHCCFCLPDVTWNQPARASQARENQPYYTTRSYARTPSPTRIALPTAALHRIAIPYDVVTHHRWHLLLLSGRRRVVLNVVALALVQYCDMAFRKLSCSLRNVP